MRFIVNKGKPEFAPMYPGPSLALVPLVDLAPDSTVESNGAVNDTPDFLEITAGDFGDSNPLKGWIETRFLTAGDLSQPVVLFEKSFVLANLHAERDFNAGGNAGLFPVAADYLLAWSLIETEMKNAAPDAANDGAGGPYAITDTQWRAYLQSGAITSGASGAARALPDLHSYTAAFLAQDQMTQFSALNSTAGAADGPYVPSYLNVLHCQLFGVKAASELNRSMTGGQGGARVDEVLKTVITDPAELAKLIARRRKYLFDGPGARTVELLFTKTTSLLNEQLLKASRLIEKHAPAAIPSQDALAGDAPWFTVAQDQLSLWKAGNLVESDAEGKRKVLEYFKETDSGITAVKPWCGAFIAFCLAKAGNASRESIVSSSATAARWKSWGNTELRRNLPNAIPKGAIVVTVPLAAGASGHVGFFARQIDAGHIEILGGNQQNRVKLMKIEREKIVAIRWCDFTPQVPGSVVPTPIGGSPVNATDQDVLILARTLYGEARDQPVQGIEAVANVVINRVASGRWKPTVEGVCLQPFQFSCWNRNDVNFPQIKNKQPGADRDFDKCFEIARKAVAGGLPSHVGKATHYHARNIPTPSWVRQSPNAKLVATIGAHLFYENIK